MSRWLKVGALLGALLVGPEVQAYDSADNASLDLGLKFGFVVGSLVEVKADPDDDTNAITTEFTYSGFPIGLNVTFDFLRWFSVSPELQFVWDLANAQITRTGIGATAAFHVWGGARRVLDDYDAMVIMSRDAMGFSLLARPVFQRYTASQRDAPANNIDGSVFELQLGGEFRMEVGTKSAFSAAFLYSLITLPGSVNRITPSILQFELGWRIFL